MPAGGEGTGTNLFTFGEGGSRAGFPTGTVDLWGGSNAPVSGVTADLAAQLGQRNRSRNLMLEILGLGPQSTIRQGGGLLEQPFFSSVIGNTLPDVVGGITGAVNIPGIGGGGDEGGGGGEGPLFQQLLQSRGALGEDILGDIEQFGESHRQRIGQEFDVSAANAMANLERRGLGASNLAPATTSAVESARQQSLLGLEDVLLGKQIGAKQQIGEGIFGDVGAELQRQFGRQQQLLPFLQGILGPALSF